MRGSRTLTAALVVAALLTVVVIWMERSRTHSPTHRADVSPAAAPAAPASPAAAPAPEPPPPPSNSSDENPG
jgi:hypothetical protein